MFDDEDMFETGSEERTGVEYSGFELGGRVEITCRDGEKSAIRKFFIDIIADLYANSCDIGYGDGRSETHNEMVRNTVEQTICVITETETGLRAYIDDIESGCLSMVYRITGKEEYWNSFETTDELTFNHAFRRLIEAFPTITFEAALTITYFDDVDRFELYHTENGKLVREYGLFCGCCGKIFTPENAFWYPDPEDTLAHIATEGPISLCSSECAREVIFHKEKDRYGLMEYNSREIRRKYFGLK